MPGIKQIIEKSDTWQGKLFDLCIQALIVISLINFSMDTLPSLSEQTRSLMRAIQIFTVAVFTVEYIARIIVATNKLGFIFSFFGLIDLLAILPFYLTTGLDLRSVRAFRFFRVFRILKLAKYTRALNRFHRAFVIAREDLLLFLFVSLVMFYLASVGIYYFEYTAQPEIFSSIFHSMWWSVITLTTVGYGDMYPITVGGKVFTFVILIVGIGVVSIPAGIVASALTKAREMDD